MPSKKNFEQNLKELEEVVEKLESGSVSLDQSIKLFQKGRELGRLCEERLKEAELKIRELVDSEAGEEGLKDFELENGVEEEAD